MATRPLPFAAPIEEVLVFEDRARVVRRGQIELSAGLHRLVVGEVSPVLADKSLSVRVRSGAAQVIDARAVRRKVLLDEHRPEALRDLATRLEVLQLDLAEKRAERSRLEDALRQSDELRDVVVAEWAEDVGWGQGFRANDASTGLDAIAMRRLELAVRLGSVELELDDLGQKLEDLRSHLAAAETPRAALRADLLIEIEVKGPGRIDTLIEYTVPGACWRPEHRAELLGRTRVLFSSQACVWQNTGEDWENIGLRFSTDRPSLGIEPPRLETDRIQAQRRSSVLVVEARDHEVHDAGLGRVEGAPAPAERKGHGVPGIDDGGEPLELRAEGPVTVRSDGRPCRAALHHFESKAKLEHVCLPELVPSVILKSTLANTSPRPILAGPVYLIRQSGLTGRTRIDFVAPGERFELGWGPLSEVSVARDRSSLGVADATLTAWSTETWQVRVRLSNLMSTPLSVRLSERIPVSEIEKIVIELDPRRTKPPATPDDDGIIRWSLDVPPLGHTEVKLTYAVKRRADVIGTL